MIYQPLWTTELTSSLEYEKLKRYQLTTITCKTLQYSLKPRLKPEAKRKTTPKTSIRRDIRGLGTMRFVHLMTHFWLEEVGFHTKILA
jgi:hypothetical protein